ncbi:MAG: hypothetical protein ACRDOK_09840 [Streptosporangiaceae bacterium]
MLQVVVDRSERRILRTCARLAGQPGDPAGGTLRVAQHGSVHGGKVTGIRQVQYGAAVRAARPAKPGKSCTRAGQRLNGVPAARRG